MSSTGVTCDIHASTEALQWCSQCEQALCDDCVHYHSQAKASRNHKAIPVSDFRKLPAFVRSLKKTCNKHGEKTDFFCLIHENLCCPYCIQTMHKQCDGIENLQTLTKNVKSSAFVEDLETNVQDIKTSIEEILKDRTQNILNIDKQKDSLLKQIARTKSDIINYLNILEKQLVCDLTKVINKEKSRLGKLVTDLQERNSKIHQIYEDLRSIKQFAADIDVFLAIKELNQTVQTEESFMFDLQTDTSLFQTEILLQKSEDIETLENNIKTFGKILIMSKPPKKNLMKKKKPQAQLFISKGHDALTEIGQKTDDEKIVQGIIEDRNVEASDSVNVNTTEQEKEDTFDSGQDSNIEISVPRGESLNNECMPRIHLKCNTFLEIQERGKQLNACKILPEDKLLFLLSKKLIVYGTNPKKIQYVDLTSKTTDLTYIGGNVVAITLYPENQICLVDISEGREIERIKTAGQCFGIDHADGQIYTSLPHNKCIQVVDYKRNVSTECTLETVHSAFYIVFSEGRLFCSNHMTNVVFCMLTSGSTLWEYRSDILFEPFCMSLDSKGDLFVACRKNRSVIVISADGSKSTVCLKSISRLKAPRALNWCPTTDKFIVCDERSGRAVVYTYK
ncbi:uncharacterized protein LOC127728065 [Mytilus californianus]|uniref:uncharacterized protein LOC127728065 n=1 Tax=Mytilus californianus TaxID=6549 RepID=UPI0022458AA6|nr:uncharacterized protein LOC127728065 [Mytilus californianus]XP_052091217.1 uncharacterized protein LOC127728065 [Mytilus californianus]